MLDFQLAGLYQVETRALKQAVRRNLERFPEDFMFELSSEEIEELVSQNVIPGFGKLGGAIPMAFTEQGVSMLSSVLRSRSRRNTTASFESFSTRSFNSWLHHPRVPTRWASTRFPSRNPLANRKSPTVDVLIF